jgi:hypothetical protein
MVSEVSIHHGVEVACGTELFNSRQSGSRVMTGNRQYNI